MIKVIYLPLNSPEIIQTGMYDAWQAVGVDLHIFDFYQDFIAKKSLPEIRRNFILLVDAIKPDLVHMQLQFTNVIDAATIVAAKQRSSKTIFTNWTGDIRINVPGEFVGISKVIDYSLISSLGQIDLYTKAGCPNVKYWQIGYNPELYYPKRKKDFKYDISFIGANYGNMFPGTDVRLAAIKNLRNVFGARFGLFGSQYPKDIATQGQIPQKQVNDVYADSACVLSISNFNDVSHYFSDRLLMCLASGRPTITYRFPGCDSYFTNCGDLIVANNVQEIIKAVHYLKSNPEEANIIGENGYMRVLAEHTYSSRILELLQMVKIKG